MSNSSVILLSKLFLVLGGGVWPVYMFLDLKQQGRLQDDAGFGMVVSCLAGLIIGLLLAQLLFCFFAKYVLNIDKERFLSIRDEFISNLPPGNEEPEWSNRYTDWCIEVVYGK